MFDGVDDAPRRIREVLESGGLSLKKRWGQNFMISRSARERVVNELDPRPHEHVWEIGPGLGSITTLLVERARRVTVFEVDHGLIRILERRFGNRITIVAGDATRTLGEQADEQTDEAARIAGNLPYRSAAAIISALLEHPRVTASVTRMVFTVQREMAVRMVAGHGSSDYSPFSVLCRVTADPRIRGEIPPGSFYPAPQVVSSIVSLEPRATDPSIRRLCSICARALFAQRRKTIANTARILASALGREPDYVRASIENAGIDLRSRAEDVPVEQYLRLASVLKVATSSERQRYSG